MNPSSSEVSRNSAWRDTPAEVASSERLRIASPSAASSCDSRRVAAALASASVSRTTMWVRYPNLRLRPCRPARARMSAMIAAISGIVSGHIR